MAGEWFNVTFEIGSTAQKIVLPGSAGGIHELISRILNRVTLQIEKVIKMPGFAPRSGGGGSGHFANSHQAILQDQLRKYIVNTVRVGMSASYLGVSIYQNGEYLWKFIVHGHAVLTTLQSRRWWFWYLNNMLGGSYERKTSGPKGYVPPDDYIQRAINAVVNSGFIQMVAREEINKYFGIV